MCAECSQIVHRDVKAPNVLLREVESRWDVCISDFGAARRLVCMALVPMMPSGGACGRWHANCALRCGRHR